MCQAGLTLSCLGTFSESSPQYEVLEFTPSPTLRDDDAGSDNDDSRPSLRRNSGSSTRRNKRSANLKDQQSTGRKRAAKLYPLAENSPCEWSNKSNCGGGSYPILGCLNGTQQARHHGPHKNVMDNEEGNVHRICHACHNRWHTVNDPSYDFNDPNITPHNPAPMTEADKREALIQEIKYQTRKVKKNVTD